MRDAMAQGRTTSREIVTQYLTRIAMYEDKVNAVITINPHAIEEADRLGIPLRSRGFDVRERLRLKSIRTCDRFIDDFYGDDVSEDKLISILEALPDGTSELMCHPAREDAEPETTSP